MANYRDKVIVVEGNTVDRDLMKRTLEAAGFEVYASDTAREAMGIIKTASPDLVISNLLLPDISGWDLYREVRRDPKRSRLPIFLLGDKEEVGERIQAHRLGIENIFYKPLDAEELVKNVSSTLKKIRQQEGPHFSKEEKEEGIRGRIKDMGIPDLLQILNMSNKTALVYLSHSEGQEGKVFLQDGEVVHAECGDLMGEDAIYHLLSWVDGDFDVEPDVPPPFRSIDSSVENLLLEGMKRIDEEARDGETGDGKTLRDEDPESHKLVKRLFELGILERK